MKAILPIILCGGFNTSNSASSKHLLPRQFLKLQDGETLFAKSLKLINDENFLPPVIIGSRLHQEYILNEAINYSVIILEDEIRGTNFSVSISTLWAKMCFKEDVRLLILPSDNLILSKDLLLKSVDNALHLNQNSIILFGSKPTFPSTEYGYIIQEKDENTEFVSFREKPSQIKAEELMAKGTSLWHSGIVLASVSTILQEFSIYSQETLNCASLSLQDALGKRILTLKNEYSKNLKEAYFENSILENTSKISFTKMLSPWINLGDIISFKALPIDLYEYETIENIDDEEFLHKSWGYYETIFEGKNHKVKRLFIKPFQTISLQSKFKAKDYWIVVNGFAKIICKNETMVLKQGQSFALLSQVKHTIINESEVPLEVIQTQVGDGVGESDKLEYQIFYGSA